MHTILTGFGIGLGIAFGFFVSELIESLYRAYSGRFYAYFINNLRKPKPIQTPPAPAATPSPTSTTVIT